jgi:DNA-binding beta-propeller fold protein YncE
MNTHLRISVPMLIGAALLPVVVAAAIAVSLVGRQPDGSLGSAPNAIAVSQDGRTLYVANGGNNAIAVVEPGSHDPIRGFIPVGWFPTALALTANDRLLVGTDMVSDRLRPRPPGVRAEAIPTATASSRF